MHVEQATAPGNWPYRPGAHLSHDVATFMSVNLPSGQAVQAQPMSCVLRNFPAGHATIFTGHTEHMALPSAAKKPNWHMLHAVFDVAPVSLLAEPAEQ
jgi:hypothetical protein